MEELSAAEFVRLTAVEREAYLSQLLGEESAEENDYVSDSDDEDWILLPEGQSQGSENSDHEETVGDRESEVEDADDDVDEPVESEEASNEPSESTTTFVAKDKTTWSRTPPIQHQTAARNIIRQRSGPHRGTEMLSICNTFKSVFTVEMVDIIVRHTNKKATTVYHAYNVENPTKKQLIWKDLTLQEFYAFLGILITSGANNSNTDHSTDMWQSTSYPLYRAAMGINRFWNILRFIRFDDANTRAVRIVEDKAAPVRDIWTMLNSNLSTLYKPTECLTIDEQLFPYRGRTRFTQYIPSKPAKYGIKVWWICDAENSYPLTGQIYTGKSAAGRETNQGERIVRDLASPYKGSGRNISMDNFFTTLPLAKHLLSWKLTIVGTLKKNKPYIPVEMAASKTRKEFSTLFGFHENVAICSYVPKKNKAVILLSTMHSDMTVSDDIKKKPEIIQYYNKTKIGLDTMDQMLGRYTTRRRTNRWPLAFFYNILDIASLASYIIYFENNKMIRKKTNQRRLFLRQLGEELCMPTIGDRSQNVQVMRNFTTKLAIESIYGKPVDLPSKTATASGSAQAVDPTGRKVVVGSCHICYKGAFKKRRKTRKSCVACQKLVCGEHANTITKCNECTQ